MKISFLIPSLRKGGAERQFIILAKELIYAGWIVSFITYKNKAFYQTYGIKINFIEKKRKIDLNFFFKLIKKIKIDDPDIIVSCYQGIFEGPLLWARLVKVFHAKIKVYSCFRSPHFSKVSIMVEKLTSHLSVMLLTNNETAKNILINSIGVNERKVKLINNIADKYNFYPFSKGKKVKLRQKYFPGVNRYIICTIGSYIPVKNQMFIMKCIKYLLDQSEISPFYFSFFGSTDANNSTFYECISYQKENNLEFYCELNDTIENVNELLNTIDTLIVPSLYEGTPNIVMEAIMCKVPVIISKSANRSKLIVNNINGYDYNTDVVRDLVKCIKKAKTNSVDLNHNILEQKMLNFDKQKIINQYINVFSM